MRESCNKNGIVIGNDCVNKMILNDVVEVKN